MSLMNIQVRRSTAKALKALAIARNETYDEIIGRLLEVNRSACKGA